MGEMHLTHPEEFFFFNRKIQGQSLSEHVLHSLSVTSVPPSSLVLLDTPGTTPQINPHLSNTPIKDNYHVYFKLIPFYKLVKFELKLIFFHV